MHLLEGRDTTEKQERRREQIIEQVVLHAFFDESEQNQSPIALLPGDMDLLNVIVELAKGHTAEQNAQQLDPAQNQSWCVIL